MIFCIHDWAFGAKVTWHGVKRKTIQWCERGGTKKKPTVEPRSAEVSCIELNSLDDLLKFMRDNGVIVQIRPPTVDAQGCGFPHYYIYTDTPSGQFHQR